MHGTLDIAIGPPKVLTASVMIFNGDHERCITYNHFGPCALNHANIWSWISAAVAADCECDADDVHIEEDDEGNEFITAEGRRVGRLVIK